MKYVYVAGASRDLERAERAYAAVRALGCEITYDWVSAIRGAQARGLTDKQLLAAEQREHAQLDTGGVIRADALWILVPDVGMQTNGIWTELGVAACLHMLDEAPSSPPRILASRSLQGQHSIWLHFGTIVEADTIETADAMALVQLAAWHEEWQRSRSW